MSELPKPRPYITFETVYTENPVQSGFDLKPTIAWVAGNKELLSNRIDALIASAKPSPHPETIAQGDNPELDSSYTRALLGLLPDGLHRLSACDQIVGNGTLWFKPIEPDGSIDVTDNINEAMSPTAITTGGTTDAMNPPALSVMLCKLPDAAIPDADVRKILSGVTTIHEYLHTATWALLRNPDKKIQLPDGSITSGSQYILEKFGSAAQTHGPISHYSRGYRNDDNTFQSRDGDTNLAIEEEFVESLTTATLGFACGSLTDITKDPFEGKEEVKQLCLDFLNATPVAPALSERAA